MTQPQTLRPNQAKEDMSATRKLHRILNGDENIDRGTVWALVATVFFKYGISPLIVLLFAYWLQEKDHQIMAQQQKSFDQTERVTMVMDNSNKVIESNSKALENLTRELREARK